MLAWVYSGQLDPFPSPILYAEVYNGRGGKGLAGQTRLGCTHIVLHKGTSEAVQLKGIREL